MKNYFFKRKTSYGASNEMPYNLLFMLEAHHIFCAGRKLTAIQFSTDLFQGKVLNVLRSFFN